MLSLLRRLAKDEEAWPTLFKNSLTRTIAIHRRFSGPIIQEQASWIATDAPLVSSGLSIGERETTFEWMLKKQ